MFECSLEVQYLQQICIALLNYLFLPLQGHFLSGTMNIIALYSWNRFSQFEMVHYHCSLQVFREIAREKGFKDSVQYLKEHIGFLCNVWMKRGFPMVDFPSSVVQMNTKEFFRYQKDSYVALAYMLISGDLSDKLKSP